MALSRVDWLLHEATATRSLPVSQRMELDDEHWRATIERLELGPGLRVFLTEAEIRKEFSVQPRDTETEPWVANNVAISGEVEIEMPDGRRTAVGPERAVMYRPSARNPRYTHPRRQRLRLAGYALRGDRLERAFDGTVPAVLRPLIAREVRESHIVEIAATKRLRSLASALFAPGLSGPLRTLFMEGTVLQLMALAAAAAGQPAIAAPKALSPGQRQAVLEARERLLADMRMPPLLGELAAAVGLSEKRLNAAFRAEFGATVFEVLRNERLEHARLALEDGAPLKQVAFRVGYNHVTNFINAFTARYGTPPRRYVVGR